MLITVRALTLSGHDDVIDGFGDEEGWEKVDTSGYRFEIGWKYSLDQPYHEGHVDQHENSGWPLQDEVDENVQGIFMFVKLLKVGEFLIVIISDWHLYYSPFIVNDI